VQARLPWAAFDRAVTQLRGDYKVQRARCRSHVLVLLLAMLRGQHSLRRIENGLSARQRYLRAFGIGSVDRSTVSHANRHRPAEAAETLFQGLLTQAQARAMRHGFPFRQKVWTLDATVIQVSTVLYEWARCAQDEAGIKLHVFLDQDGVLPGLVEFGTLKTSELKLARQRLYPPGMVLCFDQGYFDTAWFRRLTDGSVTFVTRLPPRPRYEVLKERPRDGASNVLADEVIRFTSNGCRRHYPRPLRLITFCDAATGHLLWFLTNQMTWSAETVAAVYKSRWQIELFFKWLKQHLKLSHLLGRNANAVRWQVLLALCLYLLLVAFGHQYQVPRSELLWRLNQYLFDDTTLSKLLKHSYQFQP